MPINSTPNMSLPLPVVGQEAGPQYATDVNDSLTIIDGHNHNPGSGVQVTTSGLNINSDLSIGNNNLTLVKSVRFQSQGSPLAGASDLGCLYESGVDLYYNDGSGNQIQLTSGGAIVGTAGSISGLVAPASASYNTGSSTFIWQSAANTPANMDAGSYIFRNIVANSKGLTLNPPAAMGSNYTLTLPSIPGAQNFLSLDTSGNIVATWNVDNSTINFTGNNIQIKPAGITTTQISATAGILGSQLSASAAIVGTQLSSTAGILVNQLAAMPDSQTAALNGFALSPSSGSFSTGTGGPTDITNLNITITTSGRPICIGLIPVQGGSGSAIAATMTSPTPASFNIFLRETSPSSAILAQFNWLLDNTVAPTPYTTYFASNIVTMFVLAAGTYSIKAQVFGGAGVTGIGVSDMQLFAYEI